jgi:hypothetical protein
MLLYEARSGNRVVETGGLSVANPCHGRYARHIMGMIARIISLITGLADMPGTDHSLPFSGETSPF